MQVFRFSLLVLLLTPIFITNCARNSGSGDKPSLFQSDFQRSKLICGLSECPRSVGRLLMYDAKKDDIFTCTTFVVSGNVMATNDHCIPSGLVAGSDCSQVMGVTFADGQKNWCQNILWRSGDGEATNKMSVDVAYFTIAQPVNRLGLQFNRSGSEDGQVVKIYKVDPPSGEDLIQTLWVDKCRVSLKTRFFPFLDTKDSPAFVLLKQKNQNSSDSDQALCNLIPGNSGSPAVDENGDLRAIVHVRVTINSLTNFAVAVNTACMPDAFNLSSFVSPQHCSLLNNENLDSKVEAEVLEKEIQRAANEDSDKISLELQKNYPMFKWTLTAREIEQGFSKNRLTVPVPQCALKTSHLDKKYEGLIWGYKNASTEEISLPTYTYGVGWDEDLRLTIPLTQNNSFTLHGKMSFEPQKLHDGKPSGVILTYFGGSPVREIPFFADFVNPCP